MENFTPASGFAGGLLIGLSATLLLVLNGRIAGVSGILGGALIGWRGDLAWRVAFVIGLIAGPLLYGWAYRTPTIAIDVGMPALIAAGFLVGWGTQVGGGCTSGHGVCGLSRGSARSIAATVVFMATAMITVYLARHGIGG